MRLAGLNEQCVHVVFQSSNYQSRLFKLLNPDFQHCYIIKESSCKNNWILLETTVSCINVELYNTQLFPRISDIIDKNATVLTVITRFNTKSSAQLGILSCVDVTKRFLGIRDLWCFTPYQLYKNLIGGRYEQSIIARKERS